MSKSLLGTLTPIGALGKGIGKVWSGLVGLVGSLITSIVAPSSDEPTAIYVTGTYTPTVSVTGTYQASVSVTGAYEPAIHVTGEASL
jgi:hypothetical protein